MSMIDRARARYRPDVIKVLFVAESPPASPDRFFYYERVRKQDSLYLELMRAIFQFDGPVQQLRDQKSKWLSRFRNEGFFLMDALSEPIGVSGTAAKCRRIVSERETFEMLLSRQIERSTPIVLISRPVYDALAKYLSGEGYNVANKEMIDFPGSGRQKIFRDKLLELWEDIET